MKRSRASRLRHTPQFPEEGAHLIGKQLRLFQRCEMPASRHDAPATNVGEYPRRGGARRPDDFAWEFRVTGRHRDRSAGRQDRRAVQAGIIGPERRSDRPGKPIERYVGEHAVPADRALDVASAIRPSAKLLHDPRRQAGRRIGETEGERLRARALDPLITGFFAHPLRKFAQVTPLLLARGLRPSSG